MIENYVLKTDRNRQWQKLEARLSKTATKRQIKACSDYFFQGVDKKSNNFTWSDRFRLYRNPTLEGWQLLFDEEVPELLTDSDYGTLQSYFCGQLREGLFGVEDQDYYFKSAFGERYDAARKFPLRINREKAHRTITLTPNKILRQLMTNFSWYMDDINFEEAGILRFNLGYLDSLLPLVTSLFFRLERHSTGDHTDDGERLGAVQSATRKMLKWSYASPSEMLDQPRIEAARAVRAVFLAHADRLGEFNALHDLVKKELESGE